ncbi:MAG TPA: hypothetical protein VLS51_08545 [Propionibacteriaceae bacterium]|nr:hypothetical protein [Propionibacteriaceae bacterium]
MTTNGHPLGIRPVIPADASELDKYRTLHTFDSPTVCGDLVTVDRLAVNDAQTGETHVRQLVAHWLLTPLGPLRRYLTPDEADELADLLKLNARQARSGIIAASPAGARIRDTPQA